MVKSRHGEKSSVDVEFDEFGPQSAAPVPVITTSRFSKFAVAVRNAAVGVAAWLAMLPLPN